MKKQCSFCGKIFETNRKSRVFCSLSCSAKKLVSIKRAKRERETSKKCVKCGTNKVYSEFAIKNAERYIYASECKMCHREYRSEFYKNNRSEEIIRTSSFRKSKKNWINSIKNGLKCTRCGESDNAVLQFHHIDPKTKEFQISSAACLGISKERILREIDKCEILCANCHFKEHAG